CACVKGNQAAIVASASPFANDSKTIATSTGVTFTSKPTDSMTSFKTEEEVISESQGVETSSTDSPFASSTPSIHLDVLSLLSATHCFATSSISLSASAASYIMSSISSISHSN